MTDPEDAHWYCLKTRPKREHIATAHLKLLSEVESFNVGLRVQRPTRRGLRWFSESLFPGYLFARFQFAESFRAVQACNGIHAIVHFGLRYAVVPSEMIEELRRLGGEKLEIIIPNVIEVGKEVEIADGPFGGLTAIVTRALPGRERIQILLTFLGQEVKTEISRHSVLARSEDRFPSFLHRSAADGFQSDSSDRSAHG
ncbi:MAG: transcription termination/antitermination NusG family protein [Chthoniobacteraceae bacterium]